VANVIQRPQASVFWNQDSVEYNLCFRKVAVGALKKAKGIGRMAKKGDKLVKGAWVVMTVSMLANLIYEFYWNRRISPLSVVFLVVLGVYVVGLLTGKTMVGDRRVGIALWLIGFLVGIGLALITLITSMR
jgi:hypothetical protein